MGGYIPVVRFKIVIREVSCFFVTILMASKGLLPTLAMCHIFLVER